MSKELKVTFAGNDVPADFDEAISRARAVDGLHISLFQAPASLDYGVPAPFVDFRGDCKSQAFGAAGLSVIEDVASGKLH